MFKNLKSNNILLIALAPALVHFGPLAILETYRIWRWSRRITGESS